MPWPDRSVAEWTEEIAEDMGLIQLHISTAFREGRREDERVISFAAALKESRRLTNDLYRMAEKAGITREMIDAVRT